MPKEERKKTPWERHQEMLERICCPKHGRKYRRDSKSRYGGFYCTKRLPDGSWCDWYRTDKQLPPVNLTSCMDDGEAQELAEKLYVTACQSAGKDPTKEHRWVYF